jgi:hypothetical protein
MMSPRLTRPPDSFGVKFLEWFRDTTERGWSSGIIPAWHAATRWVGGISDTEIETVERKWSVHFPPDYRLFLRTLHAPDRWISRTRFVSQTQTEEVLTPSFFNWNLDGEALAAAFAWPFEGLRFDLEHNQLWPASWGSRPADLQEQIAEMRRRLERAPRVIPICGHRYLLGEPCRAGNPVLSVYQSDIIVYGADLRRFLLNELSALLGTQADHSAKVDIAAIPFWGEIMLGG